MPYPKILTWPACASLMLLCACTPKPSLRAPLPPIALGELTLQDLQPCEPLVADAQPTAGSAYLARAENDGRHAACQERHTALAGIVWEAIRRRLIDLKEQP